MTKFAHIRLFRAVGRPRILAFNLEFILKSLHLPREQPKGEHERIKLCPFVQFQNGVWASRGEEV